MTQTPEKPPIKLAINNRKKPNAFFEYLKTPSPNVQTVAIVYGLFAASFITTIILIGQGVGVPVDHTSIPPLHNIPGGELEPK